LRQSRSQGKVKNLNLAQILLLLRLEQTTKIHFKRSKVEVRFPVTRHSAKFDLICTREQEFLTKLGIYINPHKTDNKTNIDYKNRFSTHKARLAARYLQGMPGIQTAYHFKDKYFFFVECFIEVFKICILELGNSLSVHQMNCFKVENEYFPVLR
jgi:hypothetical protein